MKCFEGATYAIMVHKLYAERVQSFLGGSGQQWTLMQRATGSLSDGETALEDQHCRITVLDTPRLKGVSQARRGYVLLLMEHVGIPIARFSLLSPMARQNISWVGRISHSTVVSGNRLDQDDDTALESRSVGAVIWTTCLKSLHQGSKGVSDMILRVDCHPRELIPDICRQMQQCASQMDGTTGACNDADPTKTITDPFEGPILMTMSRSKCSHRLTIIALTQPSTSKRCAVDTTGSAMKAVTQSFTVHDSSDTCTTYYWGLEDRSNPDDAILMQLKLNHEAAEEVVVVPADKAGRDTQAGIASSTPLSRAYYKLHQVWHDFLSADPCWTRLEHLNVSTKHGLDLGASPGGWTQVLTHCFGCTKVVAVDAGIVAQRALSAIPLSSGNAVAVHVQSSMELADLTIAEPYVVLVCDASLGWTELLDLMVAAVRRCSWTLPAAAVITLKMPFKTVGSIQRHVEDMQRKLPSFLRDLEQSMYSNESSPQESKDGATGSQESPYCARRIRTRYRLVHLMANADSERTVVVVFEPDDLTA
jgi:FtsJ-like methyltransferase